MPDLRPRPDEYRNVCRALLQAFGAMYTDPPRARRGFAAMLVARGRVAALLALRTDPERFGALLPAVEPRVRDFADEAAESFALCREHCTRPLVREAARHLRAVHATHAREQRLHAAKTHAAHLAGQLQDGIELRVATDEQHARMMAWAPRLYVDPQRAIQEIRRRLRAWDRKRGDFWLMYYFKWKRFGRPRRTWRKGWRGWLGFVDHKAEENLVLYFRSEIETWVSLLERQPGPEWMPEAQAAAEAAAAAVAAIEAEPLPVQDPERAVRMAAHLLLDAMRLLERFPSDAAPHLARQLAPMLPEDAQDYLVPKALRLAAQYDAADNGKRGAGNRDDGRGRGYDR